VGEFGIEPKEARMSRDWTLLSHHAHVLIALDQDPDYTFDQLAQILGLTSRTIANLINDLVDEGYVSKSRDGRNNHYEINRDAPLRHATSQGKTIGQLIAALGELGEN
jgi:DNA-binding MarR family transcriptional regulator